MVLRGVFWCGCFWVSFRYVCWVGSRVWGCFDLVVSLGSCLVWALCAHCGFVVLLDVGSEVGWWGMCFTSEFGGKEDGDLCLLGFALLLV